MKKYFFLLSFISLAGLATVGCSEKKVETISQNMDAEGEADSLSKGIATPDSLDNYVKGTFNGKAKEFKYIMFDAQKATYTKASDNSVSVANFVRASESDARERITIILTGLDLEKATFPFTFTVQDNSKSARFVYEVKKSGVFIPYYIARPQDAEFTINSYKDGIVEGTFKGKATNAAMHAIEAVEGSFKMKLEAK